MQRSVAKLILVAATTLLLGVLASTAQAQISYGPCPETNDFACGRLVVPLDPSGHTPGSITLAIRRHRAPVGTARSAVIALAGGPGQAANSFAENFTQLLGPILSTRDLIVFDQRGTGDSGGLACRALGGPDENGPPSMLIPECATQLGPTRGFYTTADSVADIEAIRQASGYEKLVLYGTSYGTKVAEQYAQDYPSHVEALVLDSVVAPDGPDQLDRSTFAAIPRVLAQLCAQKACSHITPHPDRDLAELVQRLRKGPISGRVIDGSGVAHTVRVSSNDLLGMLIAGDLAPVLRAQFPAAVRAALDGDTAALARLDAYASNGSPEGSADGIDVPLYLATTCEEEQFPWNRAATPAERLKQAIGVAEKLPPSTFAPFTAANAINLSDIPECAYWPFATSGPLIDEAPLPAVPTLILSGADDLRTPTADARALAARIPGSHLLVVPDTGHSVLGTDPSSCSSDALDALFAGRPIKPCATGAVPASQRPTPLPPARLADVTPAKGYHGRVGRTLEAVRRTLSDFSYQLTLKASSQFGALLGGPPKLKVGGLRSGWASLTGEGLSFHRYTYVPGVSIEGSIATGKATLHIGGSEAAQGTLRLGPRETLSGTLDGQRVHLASVSPKAVTAQVAAAGSLTIR
jgi:pimeloyl-ACP methyl ester carboxylesterase